MSRPRSAAGGLRSAILAAAWLCTCIFGASAQATGVAHLHRATVPVTDRSDTAFARAGATALEQVLVKLTGDRAVTRQAGVGKLLGRSRELMLQFGYRDADDGALTLFAEFDERALSRELQRLGVRPWAKERPDTVAWLIVDEGASRRLVGGDEAGRLGDTLLARADLRGVPVLLPLMDVEESQHLVYAADWDSLSTTALALARRYGTPAVLIGYLRQSAPGFWDARWQVAVGDERFEVRQEGDIPELLVEEGVDVLADALARRFADATGGAAERLSVTVFGVGSAADYARVLTYLESLDVVSDVFVRAASGQSVTYELAARGGNSALGQGIGFGQVLSPVPGRADAYQLLP